MRLWRFAFSHDAFYRLPEKKRIFWVQLAQIRNDLRTIDGMCIPSLNVVRPGEAERQYSEHERWIALHQLTFAVRQLCGTLEEAHKVVQKRWHRTQLSKEMDASLSEEAEDVRYNAIVRAIGGENIREVVARLYDEPRQLALHPLETFADEVLLKIAKELDLKIKEADVAEPPDHKTLRPFLLFPE